MGVGEEGHLLLGCAHKEETGGVEELQTIIIVARRELLEGGS